MAPSTTSIGHNFHIWHLLEEPETGLWVGKLHCFNGELTESTSILLAAPISR